MLRLLLVLILISTFFSCKKEDEVETIKPNPITNNNPKVNASFTLEILFNKDSNNTYLFKNTSKQATSYKWIISTGDTSSSKDLSYVFKQLGTYKVTLIAKTDTFSHSFSRFIVVEDIIGLDSNKHPIPGSKPSPNFEVFYNVDSANFVHFNNLSSNFNKVTWDFGDNTKSTELNPIHYFTSNGRQNVKLITEGRYGSKDSITLVLFNTAGNSSFDLKYQITSASPITYNFSNKQSYLNKISHISFNNSPFVEMKPYYAEASNIFQDFKSHVYITYYKYGKVTQYKYNYTRNFENYFQILSNITGSYNFNTRRKLESTSSNPSKIDTTNYSDTSLIVSATNGKLRLYDSKLNHLFEGYLSNSSNDNEYVFRFLYYEDYNLGLYDEATFTKSINSNNIRIIRQQNSGIKVSTSAIVEYLGTK